jgi:hypothetical protein
MAVDKMRRRVRVFHAGGSISCSIGLLKYLGLGTVQVPPGQSQSGKRRHVRRSLAVAGEPVTFVLANGESYTANVVGSMKALETAYFVNRPAPNLIEAVTQHGTSYGVVV